MNAPTRPALRWFGGKWKLAPWVIAQMPKHKVYVEAFGGAASVLLQKPRAYAEIYNDLDGAVVNFFRVLRDEEQARRLVAALELTPFARQEFKAGYEPAGDPVEWARRLAIVSFMGFGSNAHNMHPTGFRANSNRSGTTPAHDWRSYPKALVQIIERWRSVVIENRDAAQVMASHDGAATLHYADPPYVWTQRSASDRADRRYTHEIDDAGHERLAATLRGLKGMVMLSGFASPLYDRLYAGWPRLSCRAYADGARARTEVLWFNPAAWAAMPRQGDLLTSRDERVASRREAAE